MACVRRRTDVASSNQRASLVQTKSTASSDALQFETTDVFVRLLLLLWWKKTLMNSAKLPAFQSKEFYTGGEEEEWIFFFLDS